MVHIEAIVENQEFDCLMHALLEQDDNLDYSFVHNDCLCESL